MNMLIRSLVTNQLSPDEYDINEGYIDQSAQSRWICYVNEDSIDQSAQSRWIRCPDSEL